MSSLFRCKVYFNEPVALNTNTRHYYKKSYSSLNTSVAGDMISFDYSEVGTIQILNWHLSYLVTHNRDLCEQVSFSNKQTPGACAYLKDPKLSS